MHIDENTNIWEKNNANETDSFYAFVGVEISSKLLSITTIHQYAVFRSSSTCSTLHTTI